jgi:hypothetical protein
MEMVKVSPLPVGPLSVTSATKVQGPPLFVQVPAMVAELPLISSERLDRAHRCHAARRGFLLSLHRKSAAGSQG